MTSPTSEPTPATGTTPATPTGTTTTDIRALARQGELAFQEQIAALPDDALAGPSLLPGWSRATVMAHVASNAAGFVRAINGAVSGGDTRMYEDRAQRDAQIAALESAPPAELRARCAHESTRLADTWAGLSAEQWTLDFTSGQGKLLPVRRSVMFSAREVWVHLVDLNAGPGFDAVPAPINEAVLREVWLSWTTRGTHTGLAITTTAADGASLTLGAAEDEDVTLVRGSLAQLTAWATGRARPDHAATTHHDLPSATRNDRPASLPSAPDWI